MGLDGITAGGDFLAVDVGELAVFGEEIGEGFGVSLVECDDEVLGGLFEAGDWGIRFFGMGEMACEQGEGNSRGGQEAWFHNERMLWGSWKDSGG